MAQLRGILRTGIRKKEVKPTTKDLKFFTKERKRLQKEISLRHNIEEQRAEIMKLQEELNPSARTKLKKFMDSSTELVVHLGKGVGELSKMVKESEMKKSQPKVTVIKAK